MSAINADTREVWQHIADELSKQRPYPGRMVTITGGRKHKGKRGKVLRHQQDRFFDAFRYGNEASAHMTEMAGRYGYVCLVENEANPTDKFWVKADYCQCEE
jgi:hypothetical protein